MCLRVSAVFPLFSPLNILHTLFLCSLSVPVLLPCVFRPSVSLSPPPFLAFPPLVLRSSCLLCVSCCVPSCPLPSPRPRGLFRPAFCVRAPEALRRPAVCPAACPSLVSHQAQNGVTVWADAPRVCPRPCPCLLLPMCCRCLFRGLSCLLPAVIWW